jgi:8-oxo-dGTP pyrophosphatase MutT (NUDIX family)
MFKRLVVKVYSHTPSALRLRIVRYATPNFTAGVATLLVRDSGEVLFLRFTYRKGWGLPGGMVNRNEQPEVTARREVREELGIDVDVPPPYRVEALADKQTVTFFTLARVSEAHVSAMRVDPVEIAAIEWFLIDNAPGLDAEVASITATDVEAVRAALNSAP